MSKARRSSLHMSDVSDSEQSRPIGFESDLKVKAKISVIERLQSSTSRLKRYKDSSFWKTGIFG